MKKLPECRFSFIVIVLVFSVISQCVTFPYELTSRREKWAVGETLEMYCKYKDNEITWRSINESTLTYRYFKGKKQNKQFNSAFLDVNGSTLVLQYPNLTIDWNNAHIYCEALRESDSTSQVVVADAKQITVGYKPACVKFNEAQFFWYNWTTMQFSWIAEKVSTEDPSYAVKHYASYRKVHGTKKCELYRDCECEEEEDQVKSKSRNYESCQTVNSNSCRFPTNKSGYFVFEVRSENAFGHVFAHTCVYISDFIKPRPVEEMKVTTKYNNKIIDDVPSTTITIRQPDKLHSLTYHIQTSCSNFSKNTTAIDSLQETVTKDLGILPAYSNCTVRVNCASRFQKGYWSEYFVQNFTTPPAVPVRLPEICPVCYHQLHDWKRTIIVYFKTLSREDQRGECGGYLVTYWRVSKSENVNVKEVPPYSTQFTLEVEDLDYLVFNISSWTRLLNASGFNGNLSGQKIWIRSSNALNKVLPPENITVIFNSTSKTHQISWRKSKAAGEQKFTVVWCLRNKTSDTCQESINWMELNSSVYNIDLDLGLITPDYQFKVGVASSDVHEDISGVITWSKCVYWTHQSVADQPKPSLGEQFVTDNFVSLGVNKSECSVTAKMPYVYGYLLRYIRCSTDDCADERRDMETNDRARDWQEITIDNDEKYIKVDKLESSAIYIFYLTSLTAQGPGGRSDLHITKTSQKSTKFINILIVGMAIVFGVGIIVAVYILSSCIRNSSFCADYSIKVPKTAYDDMLQSPPVYVEEREIESDVYQSEHRVRNLSRDEIVPAPDCEILSRSTSRDTSSTYAEECEEVQQPLLVGSTSNRGSEVRGSVDSGYAKARAIEVSPFLLGLNQNISEGKDISHSSTNDSPSCSSDTLLLPPDAGNELDATNVNNGVHESFSNLPQRGNIRMIEEQVVTRGNDAFRTVLNSGRIVLTAGEHSNNSDSCHDPILTIDNGITAASTTSLNDFSCLPPIHDGLPARRRDDSPFVADDTLLLAPASESAGSLSARHRDDGHCRLVADEALLPAPAPEPAVNLPGGDEIRSEEILDQEMLPTLEQTSHSRISGNDYQLTGMLSSNEPSSNDASGSSVVEIGSGRSGASDSNQDPPEEFHCDVFSSEEDLSRIKDLTGSVFDISLSHFISNSLSDSFLRSSIPHDRLLPHSANDVDDNSPFSTNPANFPSAPIGGRNDLCILPLEFTPTFSDRGLGHSSDSRSSVSEGHCYGEVANGSSVVSINEPCREDAKNIDSILDYNSVAYENPNAELLGIVPPVVSDNSAESGTNDLGQPNNPTPDFDRFESHSSVLPSTSDINTGTNNINPYVASNMTEENPFQCDT